MSTYRLFSSAVLLSLILPTVALCNDAASKAQACVACHNTGMNSLAGKGKDHLITQMKAIRAGDKAHPPVLSDFTDKDIEAVAGHLNNGK